jgi:hypothetical protein
MFKLSFSILGLLLFGCSGARPLLVDGFTTTPSGTPQHIERDDKEKLLRYLAERSDLIIICEATEARFLVDPEKKNEETEAALSEQRLANGSVYIGGNVFDVSISEILYKRPKIKSLSVARVYSTQNPFSLHTTVAPLIPKQKYILFLSKASEKDIVPELKIQNLDPEVYENVGHESVFLVTEGATEAVLKLKNDDQKLIKMVNSIASKLNG